MNVTININIAITSKYNNSNNYYNKYKHYYSEQLLQQ